MKIHIVQKGDTLWKLAKQYNVNFEELKAVNSQLTNPDLIMPGMKIKIPTGGVPIKKEAPTHHHVHHVHKEQPMVPKEKPIVSPPPIKEMPQMPPPMPQMMPQMMPPPMPQPMPQPQQPMTQQQMQAIDMSFNFYKPQMPPPPMVMPQMKKEVPKKVKKEKPIYKEKPTTTKPKEQPVLGEQVPVPPPPMPTMPPPPPTIPMMPVMPISQPCTPCYPEPYYPISPVMPGCANVMAPYYPYQPMYMPQPMYPMLPQMITPYQPNYYYQPMMEMPHGVEQCQMPFGQMEYAEQVPQPMRMYQTPDQFEEDDDFDDD